MKRIFLSIISIFVFGIIFSPPADALYMDNDEATWYSVSELLEYKNEIDQEKLSICGEDFGCRQDYFFRKLETDTEFQALEQLKQNQFIVTSVNPEAGYLRVLFFDEDMMLAHMGIRETLDINQIYIGWLENDVERIYRDGMDPSKYIQGEIQGAHHVYYWRHGDATSNIIQHNTETMINAPGLNQNNTNQIIYNISSLGNTFSAYGRFDYSNCLLEPDYEVGNECSLMFSPEKGQAYLPPRETTLINFNSVGQTENETNPDTNAADINDVNIADTNHTNLDSAITDPTDDNLLEGVINLADDNDLTEKLPVDNSLSQDDVRSQLSESIYSDGNGNPLTGNDNTLKTPDTGILPDVYSRETEFPWWLGAIIVIGFSILAWFFHLDHEKPQKS